MIIDSLSNIDKYKNLSPGIYAGLQFLKNADASIVVGEYAVNENVKAIVSEYKTVELFERGYEAHKHVIDIPYDEKKDRTFYKDPSPRGTHVDIGNGLFAIMFPEDGHSPQHYINAPEL